MDEESLSPELEFLPLENLEQPMMSSEADAVFENFLAQLDQEKEQHFREHLVMVEDEQELNSATAFSQYVFQGRRLITMIGELHSHSWVCNGHPVSVAEYITETVKRNRLCKVMLEVNPGVDPSMLGSDAIRETSASLHRIGRGDAIIPVDVRKFFLGEYGQHILYDTVFQPGMPPEEIAHHFIEPFFKKARDHPGLFSLMKEEYSEATALYLMRTYVPQLEANFRRTASQLRRLPTLDIQNMLKNDWKEVVDFYILRELLKESETNEYVLVVGNMHYMHIQKSLELLATPIGSNQTHKGVRNCVKLFRTYRV